MTITIGWWALPALITLGVAVFAIWPVPAPRGFNSVGEAVVGAMQLMAGIILALVAWLIWALLA